MTYILMTASAHVSGRRRSYGPYRYAAIVELDPVWEDAHPGTRPAMISTHARGVRRIIRRSPALWAGGKEGGRSEYQEYLALYQGLVDDLNTTPQGEAA